jgi:cytoskeletal protein CcmA (bactofilin family)
VNLAVFPLLIVALVMVAGNPDVDSAQLALTGEHQVSSLDGALIVVEADVDVPTGSEVAGPIYVVGGTLTVDGAVTGDLVQLAGTVTVGPEGRVGGQLQHTAGTLVIAPTAVIDRLTRLDLSGDTVQGQGGVIPAAVLTVTLSVIGMMLTTKRTRALDTVAAAITGHPVVSLTVGALLALTSLSVFVFMALTLVLLPVALVGLFIGVLTLGYGLVAWGHFVGSMIPIRGRRIATGVGVALAVTGVQVAAAVPILGTIVVPAVLLIGIGGVIITYYGVSPFRPAIADEG